MAPRSLFGACSQQLRVSRKPDFFLGGVSAGERNQMGSFAGFRAPVWVSGRSRAAQTMHMQRESHNLH